MKASDFTSIASRPSANQDLISILDLKFSLIILKTITAIMHTNKPLIHVGATLTTFILVICCDAARADWLKILKTKSLGGGLIETEVSYTFEPGNPDYSKLIIDCKSRKWVTSRENMSNSLAQEIASRVCK
jgi:hypothetical protein